MELSNVRVIHGPNLWAARPVLSATLSALPTRGDSIAGFRDRLNAELARQTDDPLLKLDGVLETAAKFERTSEPLRLAALVAQLTIALELSGKARVSFSSAVPGPSAQNFELLIELEGEAFTRRCLDVALELVAAAISAASYDFPAAYARLQELASEAEVGWTHAIERAALQRGIPARCLFNGSLYHLGHGVRHCRTWGASTDHTSSIGEDLGWDKALAKDVLRTVGVPVPEGRLVSDAEDAWEAASELGGEVVVKPRKANHGRGVFIGLTGRDEIMAAYAASDTECHEVIVERCVAGSEHRLLVVRGRMVAASRGDALYIAGDGERTIEALVNELNQDPRRRLEDDSPLYQVEFDDILLAVLKRQKYNPQCVPGAGVKVLLQRNGNHAVDVTDEVHPVNAEVVVLAAAAIGLDVAGVDLVVEEIGRPISEQNGAVLEVNSMPGLMMHLEPATGEPRPVNEIIVASLFPPGEDGRVPVVAVDAGSQTAQIAELIASRLQAANVCTGLATGEGTWVNGKPVRIGAGQAAQLAADLLMHPHIEAAVMETPAERVVADGLGFDRCHVALISGAAGAGEDARAARRLLISTLAANGIALVDADSPDLDALRAACSGAFVAVSRANVEAGIAAAIAHVVADVERWRNVRR